MVRKTPLFAPFIYKNEIISPRQARDKHRESTQKKSGGFRMQVGGKAAGTGAAVSKNGHFEPFIYKNEHFTKTGSGQT